jgi:hypothetical protein
MTRLVRYAARLLARAPKFAAGESDAALSARSMRIDLELAHREAARENARSGSSLGGAHRW